MGLWRFGNGRIGRVRGEPEEPSLFTSSSGSEEESEVESESESESERVDDESLVSLVRLPDEEDELEIEYDLLAGRCSKTPSPKFYMSLNILLMLTPEKRERENKVSWTCHFDNVLICLLDVLDIDTQRIPLR
jgi:hypothetical protein